MSSFSRQEQQNNLEVVRKLLEAHASVMNSIDGEDSIFYLNKVCINAVELSDKSLVLLKQLIGE